MMTRDEILRLVTDALQETTGAARERVTPSARIIEDIGADSLDLLDILFALEEKFEVKIKRGQIEAQARQGLSDDEFAHDGCLTDVAAERLRQFLPEVDPARITPGMPLARIPYLFTVETFVRLVTQKLHEKEAKG